MSSSTIQKQLALFAHMVEGLKKHMAGVTEVTFQGASYTPSVLIGTLQELVSAGGKVAVARTAFHDAVTAFRDKVRAAGPIVRGLKSYLLVLYKEAGTLADFGLVPRKPRKVPPPLTAVTATAKRKATRAARHTMGPRAKLRIKGDLPQPPAINGAAAGDPAGAPQPAATSGSAPKPANSGPAA